jgi:protein SCO1
VKKLLSHTNLFMAIVILTPILAYFVYDWFEHTYQQLPVLGGSETHTIDTFSLTNQDGFSSGTNEWDGKIVVADFFFTHCPVVCPRITKSIKRVQQAYAGDKKILFNSISVDPETDRPEILRAYAEKFAIDQSNWRLYTGKKTEIYKLARNSFMVVATDGDGGPQDFIHSENLVLIDKKRRIRGYYDGTSEKEVTQLIKDIKKLKYEK